MAEAKSQPISDQLLKQIIQDACDTTLGNAETYVHSLTEEWNNNIITKILQSLISHSANSATGKQYKFAVNATIIQHLTSSPSTGTTTATTSTGAGTQTQSPPSTPPAQTGATDDTAAGDHSADAQIGAAAESKDPSAQEPEAGRRGMRSTVGCYWNEATDGKMCYSWRDGSGRKGMDVVVSVLWVSV